MLERRSDHVKECRIHFAAMYRRGIAATLTRLASYFQETAILSVPMASMPAVLRKLRHSIRLPSIGGTEAAREISFRELCVSLARMSSRLMEYGQSMEHARRTVRPGLP